MFKGFRDFILRGNTVDLAFAVIIGGAFNTIVSALVRDIITPFIGIFGGTRDFSKISFTIGSSTFMIGEFINAFLSFLIVAAVLYYFIVIPMNTLMTHLRKGEKMGPTEKTCSECLSIIPINARRCKYCTSIVEKKEK